MAETFRSGFVSIVGLPNAGKSTLLNALIGQKLAIVAPKPQTTRTRIQGVLTLPHAQIVFLDTPGIHRSTSNFNRRMMQTVRESIDGRDLLLYVADATRDLGREDNEALDLLRKAAIPAILVLNKIDQVSDKRTLLPRIEEYRAKFEFAEYFPLSALSGDGIDRLRDGIIARLPEGTRYFPDDYLTDQPERFLVAELIREKILLLTRQEVPHSVAVLVENWEETPKLTRIAATIFVEKEGQKAIVIGAGGATLKRIGTLARGEIETLLDRKTFIELFVKVRKDWREQPQFLDELDWRSIAAGTADSEEGS